jgi:small-conductance mechanosensitive channel
MANVTNIQRQFLTLGTDVVNWIAVHNVQIIVALIIGGALVALLFAVQMVGKRMRLSLNPVRAVIGRGLAAMRLWFMIAVAAQLVAVYAHAPEDIARTVNFGFIVAATLQCAMILRGLILGGVEARAQIADPDGTLGGAMGLIKIVVTAILFVIAIILILSNLGVDATGLLAGLGIGGIAIGLAAQGIFADLFAALSILFDQPFRRGDTVRFEGTTGTVEAIGLKSTRIRSLSGEEVIISNTNLLSKELRNFTRSDHRRISQTLGLVYHTPVEISQGMAARLSGLLLPIEGVTFVRAGLASFGASSLDFEFVYDIASDEPDEILAVKTAVNTAILADFNRSGIAFAYPTQTTFTASPEGKLVMPYAALVPQPTK